MLGLSDRINDSDSDSRLHSEDIGLLITMMLVAINVIIIIVLHLSQQQMTKYRCPGGVLHQIFGTRVQHTKTKWTQSDLSFCKNEGS